MDFWTVTVCSIHSLTLRCMPVHFTSVASQNVRIRSVQRQFQGRVLRCLERKGRSMPLMPMSVDGTVVAANGSARFGVSRRVWVPRRTLFSSLPTALDGQRSTCIVNRRHSKLQVTAEYGKVARRTLIHDFNYRRVNRHVSRTVCCRPLPGW